MWSAGESGLIINFLCICLKLFCWEGNSHTVEFDSFLFSYFACALLNACYRVEYLFGASLVILVLVLLHETKKMPRNLDCHLLDRPVPSILNDSGDSTA